MYTEHYIRTELSNTMAAITNLRKSNYDKSIYRVTPIAYIYQTISLHLFAQNRDH